jgi:transcriptional regulator
MYNSALFREERLPVLHELVRQQPFATLVTLGPDGLVADHLPMLLDAGAGPLGTLRGHVARANPVWRVHAPAVEALAIFQGAAGYITPAWYGTKRETGKVVPTWNYVVVHAHGPLRIIEDTAWLRGLVERLTERFEAERQHPWKVSDAPEDYVETMLRAIVGVEIPIARLEGKWKVSQNRPAQDRAGVVAGLRAAGDPASRAMADLVAETETERREPR